MDTQNLELTSINEKYYFDGTKVKHCEDFLKEKYFLIENDLLSILLETNGDIRCITYKESKMKYYFHKGELIHLINLEDNTEEIYPDRKTLIKGVNDGLEIIYCNYKEESNQIYETKLNKKGEKEDHFYFIDKHNNFIHQVIDKYQNEFIYDKSNNLIEKTIFNSKNTHKIFSNGHEEILDKNNNLIYLKYSTGLELWYDENGNVSSIKVNDSNVKILDKEEDKSKQIDETSECEKFNEFKLKELVKAKKSKYTLKDRNFIIPHIFDLQNIDFSICNNKNNLKFYDEFGRITKLIHSNGNITEYSYMKNIHCKFPVYEYVEYNNSDLKTWALYDRTGKLSWKRDNRDNKRVCYFTEKYNIIIDSKQKDNFCLRIFHAKNNNLKLVKYSDSYTEIEKIKDHFMSL